MRSGLRPSPRLVFLVLLGVAPAALALVVPSAAAWVLGLDLVLLAAFVADAMMLGDDARPSVTRTAPERIEKGRAAAVTLRATAARRAKAWLVDEPPRTMVPEAEVERPIPVVLAPGAPAMVTYPVAPRKRGGFDFGPVNAIVEGPLGLARRRFVLAVATRVKVIPPVLELEQPALDVGLLAAELGIKRVRRPAEGVELDSLREAAPDEELRRIDWRATARRGKRVARVYAPERNHDVLVCLDTGRLMGALHGDPNETKLDHAIQCALRLSWAALASGDRVGVLGFDEGVSAWVPPEAGRAQVGRVLEAVHALEPAESDASYVAAMFEVRRRQKKRGLLVFIGELGDVASPEAISALAALGRRHVVLLVCVRDPEIRAAADAEPSGIGDVYRSIAALGLDEARAELIERVRAQGVLALDLTPEEVTAGTLRAYLEIRARGRI